MEFIGVLIPIFSIFAIGYIGIKFLPIDIKSISTMTLYLMSPFLAFRTFYQNELNMDYIYLGAFLLVLCMISLLFSYLVGYIRKWDQQVKSGFVLSSVFMNNGNYGVPLILLVFGEEGFHYAIILMVLQTLIMCTIGIYFAAKGGADGRRIKISPLKDVVKVPIVYGAILGILLNLFHLPINDQMMTAIDMVADATIPTIMVVLGMQLAKIKLGDLEFGRVSLAVVFRLLLAPVIAYFLTLPLPVDEMVKDILIITAAMPTAANTTMYALQFGSRPGFVSSVTLITTLLSLITLPLLLTILV
ncbi:AEC family transporter [Gracilibacillus caseinilyticus]|uniref:AEC family transporter n=1 Tax=Gracilibacillus caseinilyticus TaxID=2932256 RepID=A0ABY4F018_9BACI|nr:AEC family transporter [Gracilibacillus caseinilyticus]UOQ50005.1 AEC family transporter [Gracilibacillus caseinilyticus]